MNRSTLPTRSSLPYWRLSSFYFFYFASLGALIPYWNLYLKNQGYSASETGVIMAILLATKIISPNIWGWIADRSGKRMRIVRIGCLLAAISYSGILIDQSFAWLVVVMLVFSFFWNAALPQFEASTLNHLGDRPDDYSSIRLWGSIGFIILVISLGYLFSYISVNYLPAIVSVLLLIIWLSSLVTPEDAAGHLHLDHEPLKAVLRKPMVIPLLLISFCMQASHGPYYALFSRYIESYGYGTSSIGWFWGIAVIPEAIVFVYMTRLIKKFGLRNLLLFSLLMAAVRWTITALLADNLIMLASAQILHAATFGIYHAVVIRMIHQLFVGPHQGKGQALYSSISFGAGGAIGSLYSGFAWDHLGRPAVFGISIAFSILGFWLAYRYIRPEKIH